MKTFVIAEIGVNHNGRLDLALKLIEAAAAAGAQAAKFQTFTADAIAAPNTATVQYQNDKAGAVDQHAMLKELELSRSDYESIVRHCQACGIEFMSTAFDAASLDMLVEFGIRRIKIPSGEVTNTPYLEDCARRGLPLILSTGMADLAEVRAAVEVVRGFGLDGMTSDAFDLPALTVLHCTSAYPAEYGDVNLAAMLTMKSELGVTIGYSDHTQGIFVAPLAVALGARIVEKHITLDRNMQGPDHSASIEPAELKAMMAAIRDVERLMGDGVKEARASEFEAKALVRRGLKAARRVEAGTVLSENDIAILRPATGLAPSAYRSLIGRRLLGALDAGQPIEESNIG